MLRSTLTQKVTCQKQHRDQWLSLKVKFRKPHRRLPLYPLDTSYSINMWSKDCSSACVYLKKTEKNQSPWNHLITLRWQFFNCKSKWMSMLLVICVISVFIPETWPFTSKIFSGQYNEITCYLWEPVNSDQGEELLSKLALKWTWRLSLPACFVLPPTL